MKHTALSISVYSASDSIKSAMAHLASVFISSCASLAWRVDVACSAEAMSSGASSLASAASAHAIVQAPIPNPKS